LEEPPVLAANLESQKLLKLPINLGPAEPVAFVEWAAATERPLVKWLLESVRV
jgi:hypothetical protein